MYSDHTYLTHSKKLLKILKTFDFCRIFYWLTDWLLHLLMPSDKRNSITVRLRLDFCTVWCHFIPRCAFLPTTAAPVLASRFYQSLPLFSTVLFCFPFLSPLPCRWQFAVRTLWLQCETSISTVLAGVLLMLFFTWNAAEGVRRTRSEMKHSGTPWISDTLTFKSINGVRASMIEHLVFSHIGWIWLKRYFLCCSPFVMGWKWVDTKRTG